MFTSIIISLLITRLDARSAMKYSLLPGKSVINIIPEFFGYSSPPKPRDVNPGLPGNALPGSTLPESMLQELNVTEDYLSTFTSIDDVLDATENPPEPQFPEYPVQHAGLPRSLAVYPLPLQDAYHELKFNVTWEPPLGPRPRDYSIEVRSVTDTVDCETPLCYEYNIPGTASWWEVPANPVPVAETCAVRPGCAYSVQLLAHPWDGHTSANLLVELDECVAGVCSCAHSPRLPAPRLSAKTVSVQGEIFVNVTWITPKPEYPQRLPPGLKKLQYAVSIGKQMVSDAHPTPWFANTVTRYVPAEGLMADADDPRWLLIPVTERSDSERSKTHQLVLDVRLLARVSVIDDRGCVGPAGNVTAYDPVEASRISIGTYILWAVFGGACVLVMGALIAMGTRVVKRVLNVFRPAPVSAPLEPLRRRSAWFPLPLRRANRRTAQYHPYLVDIPSTSTKRFYSTFIIRTAKNWNTLPAAIFLPNYNLGLFLTRVNRYLSSRLSCYTVGHIVTSHQARLW